MREFNALMQADVFATAVCSLTGAQVGSVMMEQQRRQPEHEEHSEIGEDEMARHEHGTVWGYHTGDKGEGKGKKGLTNHPAHSNTPEGSADSVLTRPELPSPEPPTPQPLTPISMAQHASTQTGTNLTLTTGNTQKVHDDKQNPREH